MASYAPARILRTGEGAGAEVDLRWEAGATRADGQEMTLHLSTGPLHVVLPFPGWHMAANAALAAACGLEAGLSPDDIAAGLAAAALPKGRLALLPRGTGWILDDSYNANPDSMAAAFRTLAALPGTGRRVALLGSMGELGSRAAELHEETGAAAARAGMELLFAMGPNAADLVRGATGAGMDAAAARTFADHREISAAYRAAARPDDIILVKGSRFQAMEKIMPLLGGEC